MTEKPLHLWSAAAAAEKIRDGAITSTELVTDCLDHIAEVDGDIEAWAHLNREHALRQAEMADRASAARLPRGPLHGVPIGVKDIIDTAELPTENGTILQQGRQPREDAAIVSMLKQAGAVIMGKTVTTELAAFSPGKTRNPHNPQHTPGGSSSGSAAAVAANMVPAAVGTQTNGSVIRPASYCGVCGFKPSHGLISRTGVLPQSRWLDTVGVMARSVEDAALLAETMMQFDGRDPDASPSAIPPLREVAASEPPVTPDLVYIGTPILNQLEGYATEAFAELVEFLGEQCSLGELPEPFAKAWDYHADIVHADVARSFDGFYQSGREQLSEHVIRMIEQGRKVLATSYNEALDWRTRFNVGLDAVFDDFDAIITPATTGEAPLGLESTGSPAFCTLWTLAGVPAITLPLLQGPTGLPVGVQLIGRKGSDARLLRTARWLAARVAVEE